MKHVRGNIPVPRVKKNNEKVWMAEDINDMASV